MSQPVSWVLLDRAAPLLDRGVIVFHEEPDFDTYRIEQWEGERIKVEPPRVRFQSLL